MRTLLIALLLTAATAAGAKERATFLTGQYATAEQCAKLRLIEAGTPRNVETVPELLDADGFKSWEGRCEFTKVFEHEPGETWLVFMVCSEGLTVTPATYVFVKAEGEDRFEVHQSDDQEGPEVYTRCDAGKGN